MDPWIAERSVDVALARRLIAAQAPGVRAERIEPLGAGWDNTAYLVDDEWVFRFPRRAFAVPLVEIECRILPAIAPRLPLPVPVPAWRGAPSELFPWPFAGYRRLAGEPAYVAGLDRAARSAAAEPLARFLRALHDVPASEARALGAPLDELGRIDVAQRTAMAASNLRRARDEGIELSEPLAAALEDALGAVPADFAPELRCLAHGDLDGRHVLVDASGRPCGVIDWGDVHAGDPAVDLALAHGFLPAAARERFRRAYGPIADDAWRVARMRALASASAVLVWGRARGDRELERGARAALELVAERDA